MTGVWGPPPIYSLLPICTLFKRIGEGANTMTVEEAIRTKRAVRTFTDQPLPDDAIRAILDAGRRAQSSKNTQPWHFIAVRDRDTLQQLSTCGQFAGHMAGAALGVALVSPIPTGFDMGQ